MNELKVSIVIPCYNQGKYLRDALDSALGQTYPNVEVIVVNDGSTDDTEQVAESYRDQINYMRQDNAGPSAARNRGIDAATGSLMVFLDADDLLLPTMVEELASALATRPEAIGAHCKWMISPEDGSDTDWVHECGDEGDLFERLRTENCFAPHSVMVRHDVFGDVGMFDVSLTNIEDWEMWLRVSSTRRPWVKVDQTLVKYRQLPSSRGKCPETALASVKAIMREGMDLSGESTAGEDLDSTATGVFRERLLPHLFRISALLIANGKPEEASVMLANEMGDGLSSMEATDCGRELWLALSGAVCIPPWKWEKLWLRHAAHCSAFVAALEDNSGRPGFAEDFLGGMAPFRDARTARAEAEKIARSTSYRLGRLVTRLKFW